MAQKRMFDKIITNDDNFIELPLSSQALYFHLSMNADDDGFINNWKSIMRMLGSKEDDLKILILKYFVIPFDSGVIVIRHWRMNNYLRNDRYKPTKFQDELKQLKLDKNGVYNLYTMDTYEKENDNSKNVEISAKNSNDNQMYTTGIPLVYTDKNRLDKNRLDKNSIDNISTTTNNNSTINNSNTTNNHSNIYSRVENQNSEEKENKSESDTTYNIMQEIINYLNFKADTHYKINTNKTKSLIKARLNEKYTLDDFKKVIDIKTDEWKNTDYEKYLRPETLFGNKFESYLNQKEKPKPKTKSDEQWEIIKGVYNGKIESSW